MTICDVAGRAMALAMAPHNVRVNAIGPGSIMTDVLASVATDKAAMSKVLSRTPMGRIGDPTEVGQVSPEPCSMRLGDLTEVGHVSAEPAV